MILDLLEKLNSTSSRLDKEKILQENKDNEDLKTFFFYCLNPYFNYYIFKIPDFEHIESTMGEMDAMRSLDRLIDRTYTGNAAKDYLSSLLSCCDPKTAEIIIRIIRGKTHCGVSEKTVNKTWKGLIPTVPYMRCSSMSDKNLAKITYPALAQTKADGIFANVIVAGSSVEYLSRNGKVIDLKGYMHDNFYFLAKKSASDPDIVLHGEILVLDENGKILPRKTGNGIVNKAIKGTISDEEISRIIFKLWDIVDYKDWKKSKSTSRCIERFNNLIASMFKTGYKIQLIDHKIVNSFEEAKQFYEEQLAKGEEGAVLKNFDGVWENKTSRDCVKLKSEKECDLVIKGWKEGREDSKYKGMLGSILFETSCGKLKVYVSGMSEKFRENFNFEEYQDKIACVRFNEVILCEGGEIYSLFLPRLIEIREDKEEADDLEYVLNL